MPYAIQQDLIDQLGEAPLLQVADDDGDGELDAAVVDAAIAMAEGVVDSYLQSKVSVPLDPVPEAVKGATVDIAIWRLFSRRGYDEDSADKGIVLRWKAAMAWLQDVATGRAQVAKGDAPHTVPPRMKVSAPARDFDDDTWGGY